MERNEVRKDEKRRKKILIAILAILFTGIILSASTYAWFTANRTVRVDTININAVASNGIQISTDAVNWKPVVNATDIENATSNYAAAVNKLPDDLNPVSTVGDIDTNNGYMKMFLGSVDAVGNSYVLTAQQEVENASTGVHDNNANFVVFDLFFKLTTGAQVYLSPNSRVTVNGTDKGLQNAARVAFVNEGYVGTTAAETSAQPLHGGTGIIIWEPNYTSHKQSGVDNARNTYGKTSFTSTSSDDPYYGVKAAISSGVALNSTDSTYFSQVNPAIKTADNNTAYNNFFTLNAGVTKVRVYMWVEGQDVDCENNASGSGFDVVMAFSLDNE
jgi:hypothetical protein